ncbi:hypothetical protein [Burkholderia lata]|uniref:hypothetical protein n=1 Tax=Burkholderia lata (strain ATCC 17760 / DSM 23089 / LMG 22485 / NCIMB 9086 / R18194 / 383) TaxID=482957 RepID=UPI00158390E9|nr:hypothetical protein [Burkholderia lata]
MDLAKWHNLTNLRDHDLPIGLPHKMARRHYLPRKASRPGGRVKTRGTVNAVPPSRDMRRRRMKRPPA